MKKVSMTMIAGVVIGCSTLARAGDPTANAAATISVKAAQTTATAGSLVSVDAFVSNAADLAVFQLQLAATGGQKGSLTLESITIGKERPDFVFGEAEILDAVDMNQGRVGALRYTGGTNVVKPVYLATFHFRATNDANGTFKINLQNGNESFLNDSAAVQIPHQKSADAEVTVGKVQPTRVDTRSRK